MTERCPDCGCKLASGYHERGCPYRRNCTRCGKPARFVASGPEDIPRHPLQWFECGDHDATDNLAGVVRQKLEPLDEWLARIRQPPT